MAKDKEMGASKKTMEDHFTGKTLVGETETGHEDFPSEKLTLEARPTKEKAKDTQSQ